MFTKIVVATDVSNASDRVVNCLGRLRLLGAEEAILAYAVGLSHLHEMAPYIAKIAEPRLAEQKAALERQGFSTSVVIAPGLPMFEINHLAKERGASLIVVGSQGVTSAAEVLLGGATHAILHHASVPVLVIKFKDEEAPSRRPCEVDSRKFFHHILYATDFSDTAERAFSYVEKIVESGVKDVTLLHVQDRVKLGKHLEHRLEEFTRIDQQRLERFKGRLDALGAAKVRIEIPYGSSIREILKCAKREEDTLIVMGSQGRGFISEVFLGSVSHGVAMYTEAALLLVPALREAGSSQ